MSRPSLRSSVASRLKSVLSRLQKRAQETSSCVHPDSHVVGPPTRWANVVARMQVLTPCTRDNEMKVYNDTGEAFRLMWDAVDGAKHSVTWITYICKDDFIGRTTVQKLEAAADRGVKVELLYDDAGNISGRTGLLSTLSQHTNGRVTLFNPFLSHMLRYYMSGMKWRYSPGIRNHRKILVVDDEVAFVGGLNIGNEYAGKSVGGSGKFRDTLCCVRGPVVHQLNDIIQDTYAAMKESRFRRVASTMDIRSLLTFKMQRWMRDKRSLAPDETAAQSSAHDVILQVLASNSLTRTYHIQRAYQIAMHKAQHRVWITTPYLLPTRRLFRSLLHASRRGVDVRVMTGSVTTTDPWFMWWAGQYIAHHLLRNNVQLYEYDGGSVMHAKTVVIDGVWGSVGSYNWDALSNKLLEVSVASTDYGVARELEEQFRADMAKSRLVTRDTYLQRPLWVRFTCSFFYHFVRFLEAMTFWTYSHDEVETRLD
eukprot:PhM_4_TR11955/c0_g2_i1/m.87305/K06131/clsA_B; cardiolipin synthase A/B